MDVVCRDGVDRVLTGFVRPVLQKWFGDVRPAATMIEAGLMEEVMKIEIEVTAKKGAVSGEQTILL